MGGKATNFSLSKFLDLWAKREGMTKQEAKRLYASFCDTTSSILSGGRGIQFEGLGVFELVVLSPRRHYNMYENTFTEAGFRWRVKCVVSPTLQINVKRALDEPTKDDIDRFLPRRSKRGKQKG